jgi:hypothetical protein
MAVSSFSMDGSRIDFGHRKVHDALCRISRRQKPSTICTFANFPVDVVSFLVTHCCDGSSVLFHYGIQNPPKFDDTKFQFECYFPVLQRPVSCWLMRHEIRDKLLRVVLFGKGILQGKCSSRQ